MEDGIRLVRGRWIDKGELQRTRLVWPLTVLISPTQAIERLVAEAEKRGTQHRGQAQVVAGIMEHGQQRHQVLHFGPVVVPRPLTVR